MVQKFKFIVTLLTFAALACARVLVKRARWGFLNSGNSNALVMAVLWGGGFVVQCTGEAGLGCIGVFVIGAISSAIALIQGGVSSGDSHSKRNEFTPVLELYESVSFGPGSTQTYNASGEILSLSPYFGNFKRELFNNTIRILALGNVTSSQSILPVLVGHTESNYHLAVGAPHLVVDDLLGLVTRHIPSDFEKRSTTIEVSWVSYNWAKADRTFASRWENDERNVVYGNQLASEIDSFVAKNPSNKYCAAAQLGDNNQDRYNDIGANNLVKGELYMNAWGGLDNPCLDGRDGADMP